MGRKEQQVGDWETRVLWVKYENPTLVWFCVVVQTLCCVVMGIPIFDFNDE